jgi:hypothetical protein
MFQVASQAAGSFMEIDEIKVSKAGNIPASVIDINNIPTPNKDVLGYSLTNPSIEFDNNSESKVNRVYYPTSSPTFDGANDYIDAGITIPNSLNNSTEFSVSAWIDLNTITNDDGIFTMRYSGDGYWFWNIRPGGGSFWIGYNTTTTGAGHRTITNPFIDSIGKWVHLVTTYSTGHLKTYKDGVLIDDYTSITGNVSIPNTANLYLGGYNTAGSYVMNGSLMDFRIYNKELSSSDINLIYKKMDTNRSGLIAWFH